MQQALVSLALSGLGRDALKVAAGLVLAIVIVLAFTISSVVVVIEVVTGALLGAASVPVSVPGSPMSPSGRGAAIVAHARAELGMPYVWGGASPQTSFDCSGLVQWVYAQVGISLPRTAQEQYDATVRVSPDQLQPGDLVFFGATYPSSDPVTHVGIYVGDGRMINAPTEGNVVREMSVFTGFWGQHYLGAGRVRN
jgi:cell wall-associated NlpC family hydrolase